MSGAAAGAVKGFTIHSALKFPLNMKSSVELGTEDLPKLSASTRNALLDAWRAVKVLIINESYTLPVQCLSLIDERLRALFNISNVFGGLFVVLVGDPRQIVPVSGKPLYFFPKFEANNKSIKTNINSSHEIVHEVDNTKNKNDVQKQLERNNCGVISRYTQFLSIREIKGDGIYQSMAFRVMLSENARLEDQKLISLVHKTSAYNLCAEDIESLNKLVRNENELYSSPWIESIWMLPTWKEVNIHLHRVTEYMAKTRGICRIWTHVKINSSVSSDTARTALHAFYTSDTAVNSTWKKHLPYIDYFPGQIVALKKNWNPTWGLFNNAKAVIVGIQWANGHSQASQNIYEAIDNALHDRFIPYNILIRPFAGLQGVSASAIQKDVICAAWTISTTKCHVIRLELSGPRIVPSNGISIHQAQGATYLRAVSLINKSTYQYGMANVALSRVPQFRNLALKSPLTLE